MHVLIMLLLPVWRNKRLIDQLIDNNNQLKTVLTFPDPELSQGSEAHQPADGVACTRAAEVNSAWPSFRGYAPPAADGVA